MKPIVSMLLAVGLAVMCAGCQSQTDSDATALPTGKGQLDPSNYTLVTLQVPNMT